MDTKCVELLVVKSTTGQGLGLRTSTGEAFGHIRQALADAGFQPGDRVVIVPAPEPKGQP